jgi:hypothetical protein
MQKLVSAAFLTASVVVAGSADLLEPRERLAMTAQELAGKTVVGAGRGLGAAFA